MARVTRRFRLGKMRRLRFGSFDELTEPAIAKRSLAFDEAFADLRTAATEARAAAAALDGELAARDVAVRDLGDRVASFEKAMKDSLGGVDKALRGLDRRCTNLEQPAPAIESALRGHGEWLASLEQRAGERYHHDATPVQARDGERAELMRLRSLPRGEPGSTDLLGFPIRFLDGLEFSVQYDSIFRRRAYAFEHSGLEPLILDCGANIGMATLFWKLEYPRARIIAFEPDDRARSLLHWNLQSAQCEGVSVLPAAVMSKTGEVRFVTFGDDVGRVAGRSVHGNLSANAIASESVIPAVRLRDFLQEPVALLKLDIEGAEASVIMDCAQALRYVENAVIEFHSFTDSPQRLAEVFATLRSAGFRVSIEHEHVPTPSPLVSRADRAGMDLQLLIWCYRSERE